jgi:O-antigen/teichoic acid export membrane protein
LAVTETGSPTTRRFLSQSAGLIAANGVGAALAAAYASLSGRLLGPEGYAPVAACLALAGLFSLLLGPLETGINQLAADYHGRDERGRLAWLTAASLRRLALPLTAGVAIWLLVSPLVRWALRFEGSGELHALALYGAFSLLACVPRGVQRGDHRFFAYGMNLVFESAARLACGASAMLLGLGAAGTVGGYSAGMAAALALGLWQLRDLKAEAPAAAGSPSVYVFSLPLFIVYFYFLFVVSADVLVAKRVLSDADAGLYGACGALTRLLYLAATPIYQVLFSRVASARARGEATGRLTVAVTAGVAGALALSNLLPWLWGSELLVLVFGAKFAAGASVLRIQWATTSLLVLQAVGAFVLLGEQRTRRSWMYLLPCALLVVLLGRFHGSTTALAFGSLAAAGSGLLVVGWLLVRRE